MTSGHSAYYIIKGGLESVNIIFSAARYCQILNWRNSLIYFMAIWNKYAWFFSFALKMFLYIISVKKTFVVTRPSLERI